MYFYTQLFWHLQQLSKSHFWYLIFILVSELVSNYIAATANSDPICVYQIITSFILNKFIFYDW